MKEGLKKLRDFCRSYRHCYDGCPLDVDNKGDCVMIKPPYIWSDEDIEKITQLVKGEENGIHEN